MAKRNKGNRLATNRPADVVMGAQPEESLSGVSAPPVETVEASEDSIKLVPAYKVSAMRKQGFWRIKRKFILSPTYLLASDLSDAEIKELESVNPQWLKVELVEIPAAAE